MRRFLSSLAVQLFLLLLAGVLLAAAATFWLSDQRLIAVRREHAIERAVDLIGVLNASPAESRPQVASAYRAGWVEGTPDPSMHQDIRTSRAFSQRLGEEGAGAVYETADPRCIRTTRSLCRLVTARLSDGEEVRFVMNWYGPTRIRASDGPPILEATLFLALLAGLAALAASMAAAPMERLAGAAQRLGFDLDAPALRERGPAEVAAAARAFNSMQQQIRAQVTERTHMLAAITHDLRTPLTRMRLRLDQVADADVQDRLRGDLAAMERLINEGLELARAGQSNETARAVDFDALIGALVEDAADAGQPVTLTGTTNAIVTAAPEALSRAIANLVDNAIKFGGGAALSLDVVDRMVRLRVSDEGPGLDQEGLAHAGEAFWRAETSRSRETGGVGLGLAIAKRIVARHGGDLTIANRPVHGLLATLTLPRTGAN